MRQVPRDIECWQRNLLKSMAPTLQDMIIKGWRANASYFYIAKEFVRDNIDLDILEELFSVNYDEFNEKYNQRDITARKNMRDLVNSDANKVTNVFSTLFER